MSLSGQPEGAQIFLIMTTIIEVGSMNAQALSRATSNARQGVSDAAGKLFEISEEFAARCKDSYRDAERGVRKLRIAAEESVDHTRRQIKSHPIAAVALVG